MRWMLDGRDEGGINVLGMSNALAIATNRCMRRGEATRHVLGRMPVVSVSIAYVTSA